MNLPFAHSEEGRNAVDGFFVNTERRMNLQKQEPAVNKLALIWQFLKGSKLYFVLSILAAALMILRNFPAIGEMLAFARNHFPL